MAEYEKNYYNQRFYSNQIDEAWLIGQKLRLSNAIVDSMVAVLYKLDMWI